MMRMYTWCRPKRPCIWWNSWRKAVTKRLRLFENLSAIFFQIAEFLPNSSFMNIQQISAFVYKFNISMVQRIFVNIHYLICDTLCDTFLWYTFVIRFVIHFVIHFMIHFCDTLLWYALWYALWYTWWYTFVIHFCGCG